MMHPRFLTATAGALIMLSLAAGGCRSAGNAQPENASVGTTDEAATESASPLPLLVVDTAAPLLLDEPAEQPPAAPVGGADNSPCFVCHANYRQESLAVRHARADVGCPACHGDSFAHRNDENNTTPPEKMIARDAVDTACSECHKDHDVAPTRVIARFKKRGLDKIDTDAVVCTDCHGEHHLNVRTVTWDKKTGKLLSTNKQ